jgi:hypothetical protein
MMRRFLFCSSLLLAVLITSGSVNRAWGQGQGIARGVDPEVIAIATTSDLEELIRTISLYVLLEVDVSTQVIFRDKYLATLANYIDYRIIAAGKRTSICPGKIATFIAQKINAGASAKTAGRLAAKAFQEGAFATVPSYPEGFRL